VAAGDLAAEDQGDDAARHVLADAGERAGLDVESGFLADLAAQAVVDGLGQLEDSSGRLPVLVVAAPDEQDAAVVVGAGRRAALGLSGDSVHESVHVRPRRLCHRTR
jgi:hypothetical protein